MAIGLNDNIYVNAGKPSDPKNLNTSNQPYANVAEVLTQIPLSLRPPGLTVNIQGVEYWFKDGVGDSDLVVKTGGASITNGNGTTWNSTTNSVDLGGTLSLAITELLGNLKELKLGTDASRLANFILTTITSTLTYRGPGNPPSFHTTVANPGGKTDTTQSTDFNAVVQQTATNLSVAINNTANTEQAILNVDLSNNTVQLTLKGDGVYSDSANSRIVKGANSIQLTNTGILIDTNDVGGVKYQTVPILANLVDKSIPSWKNVQDSITKNNGSGTQYDSTNKSIDLLGDLTKNAVLNGDGSYSIQFLAILDLIVQASNSISLTINSQGLIVGPVQSSLVSDLINGTTLLAGSSILFNGRNNSQTYISSQAIEGVNAQHTVFKDGQLDNVTITDLDTNDIYDKQASTFSENVNFSDGSGNLFSSSAKTLNSFSNDILNFLTNQSSNFTQTINSLGFGGVESDGSTFDFNISDSSFEKVFSDGNFNLLTQYFQSKTGIEIFAYDSNGNFTGISSQIGGGDFDRLQLFNTNLNKIILKNGTIVITTGNKGMEYDNPLNILNLVDESIPSWKNVRDSVEEKNYQFQSFTVDSNTSDSANVTFRGQIEIDDTSEIKDTYISSVKWQIRSASTSNVFIYPPAGDSLTNLANYIDSNIGVSDVFSIRPVPIYTGSGLGSVGFDYKILYR